MHPRMAELPPDVHARLQAQWLRMARQLVSQGEDVGEAFAQEARRIHEGEAPERHIHGQTTMQEARQLLEDGIAVIPLPDVVKNTVQ